MEGNAIKFPFVFGYIFVFLVSSIYLVIYLLITYYANSQCFN